MIQPPLFAPAVVEAAQAGDLPVAQMRPRRAFSPSGQGANVAPMFSAIGLPVGADESNVPEIPPAR